MIEFKIRFKNGDVGYFRIEGINTMEQANELKKIAAKAFNNEVTGGIEMIDLSDDKITLIDISEIVTLGYSLVD